LYISFLIRNFVTVLNLKIYKDEDKRFSDRKSHKMYMRNGDYTKDDGTVTILLEDDKKSFTAGGFTYYKN
jgi:hypothetical protein